MDLKKKFLKIIQLTDTHLFKNSNFLLQNVNTNSAFEILLNKIESDLNDTDAIFLTGDLSQDESKESYDIISNALKNFNKQIFWIPGNHDSISNMYLAFNNKKNFNQGTIFLTDTWDFIFLNTKREGKEYGYLPSEELLKIRNQLNKNRKNPIALVMHHHPTEVKTPLIDHYILENRSELFKIISGTTVKLIICGHVHNDYSFKYDNIWIETAPATCFQLKKGTSNLSIENNVGYKIYYFSSEYYVAQTKLWAN